MNNNQLNPSGFAPDSIIGTTGETKEGSEIKEASASLANNPRDLETSETPDAVDWSSQLVARPGKLFEWARRSCHSTRPSCLTGIIDATPSSLPRELLFSHDSTCSADRSANGLPIAAVLNKDLEAFAADETPLVTLSDHNRVKSDLSVASMALATPAAIAPGSPIGSPCAKSVSPPLAPTTRKYATTIDNLLSRTLASDQQASLSLQQMLKNASETQLPVLQREIMARLSLMVSSRFGNFVVQRMLEVSDVGFVENVAFAKLRGQVAQLALNSFACYVLQKLLDVGSQQIRQAILDEMLADVVQTITNNSGTHVWQKLLHLPWPDTLPSVVRQVSVALDSAFAAELQKSDPAGGECSGWMYVLPFPPGAAAARSLIGASHLPGAAQVLNRLSQSLDVLIANPNLQSIALRMAQGVNVYRDRVLEHVLAHAQEYASSPETVLFLKDLLALGIPSFKSDLKSRLTEVPPELALALQD